MAKEEKKRPKNLQRLDDYNTLRRETKGFQPKNITPPEFSVKENLTYAAKQGVNKAKEVGRNVVDKAKDIKDKAGEALKTLQNPTAAKEAFEKRKEAREAKKAKGGSIKKMAYGGKAMKMAEGGSLPMVKKDGKMVPAFAADGVGKMSYGGKVKKMAYGGKAMKMADGKMVTKKKKTTKVAKRRGDGCAVRGKTKGRMV